MSHDLTESLRAYLFETSADGQPGEHWVMAPDWLDDVRRLSDSSGMPLWVPSFSLDRPQYLLGRPIEVRRDGGAPHLEPS